VLCLEVSGVARQFQIHDATPAARRFISYIEMKYFLTNFLVTLSAYGLTSFVYPSEGSLRIYLMWAAPILGTLIALFVTRASLLGLTVGAAAIAMYTVSGIYCIVDHEKTIIDTLQYVTIAYFLPGTTLALLVGVLAKCIIRQRRSVNRNRCSK
jgi:hypothetical protein